MCIGRKKLCLILSDFRFKDVFSGLRQYLTKESPFKKAFYFTLKTLFILKMFKPFVMSFRSCKKTARLERPMSKFMASQPGKQTTAMHILPNILRSKGNQIKKLGQLMEYSMRNIYLEKSYTKYAGETIPEPFSKISKVGVSLHQ